MGQPSNASKKKNPLVWIFVGIAAIIGMVVIFLGVTVLLGRRDFDADVLKSGESVAIAKLLLKTNPDAELISEDPVDGWIIVRSKSTGKRRKMRADPKSKQVVTQDLPEDSSTK